MTAPTPTPTAATSTTPTPAASADHERDRAPAHHHRPTACRPSVVLTAGRTLERERRAFKVAVAPGTPDERVVLQRRVDGIWSTVDAHGSRPTGTGPAGGRRAETAVRSGGPRSARPTTTWPRPRPGFGSAPAELRTGHDGPMTSIEVSGPPVDRSAEVLTPEALEFLADLQRQFGARRDELLAARRTRRERIGGRRAAGVPGDTSEIRGADWQVAPAPRDLQDRRVEITGPTEPQDGDQRAELRCPRLAGRPRGRQHPPLAQRRRGPGQPRRRRAAHHRVHVAGGQGLPAGRPGPPAGDPAPAARLAPRRGPPDVDGRPVVGGARRLRPVLLPQRGASSSARQRPVLLPAEDGVATSRRGSGTTCSATRSASWGSRRVRCARRC